MKLVVGLGNPGSQYARTRHNIGFMILDQLATDLHAPAWKLDTKFKAEVSEANIDNEKVILAKPQTFMNDSGSAVQKIMQFYKIDPADVWVVFDDVDVPFGRLKLRHDGSAGGHNGVKSTIANIGQDFIRVRVGISLNDRAIESSEVYVLRPFKPEEQKDLPFVIGAASTFIAEQLNASELADQAITLI